MADIDGLAQDCSNSSANALELLQSYTKPLICPVQGYVVFRQIKLHSFPHAFSVPFIQCSLWFPSTSLLSGKCHGLTWPMCLTTVVTGYAAGCRYNAVQYNMILHTSLQWLRQSINQEFEPTKYIPYLALTGELWDVFCEDLGGNWPCYNSTALYCPGGYYLDLDTMTQKGRLTRYTLNTLSFGHYKTDALSVNQFLATRLKIVCL